jgi:serine/threonine-protein kinase
MIGETFGNYRLLRCLGSGAMGTVYLGEHERIARWAAVKVLAPQFAEDADVLRRFFDEARATSLIHHPAIVEVLDCGLHADGRRPYIAMEYLEGETLAARLERSGPLAWPEACAAARQIAHGLDAAHRHRIVHRDVKPANVMLVEGPDAPPGASLPAAKLLDFGVAKLLRDTQSRARTSPGQLLGTPEYMAPEQCAGDGNVDGRTDIYALGCVLFEMLCRRPPFFARRLGELILAHQWREPPAASTYAVLPSALDALIARMLSKRPDARPPDMASVIDALGRVLEGEGSGAGVIAEPSTEVEGLARGAPPQEGPPARHHHPLPTGLLVLCAGFLAVAAVGVAAFPFDHRGRGSGNRPAQGPLRASAPSRVPIAAAPTLPAVRAVAPPAPTLEPASLAPAPAASAAPPPVPRPDRRAPPRRSRSARAPKVDSDGIVDL